MNQTSGANFVSCSTTIPKPLELFSKDLIKGELLVPSNPNQIVNRHSIFKKMNFEQIVPLPIKILKPLKQQKKKGSSAQPRMAIFHENQKDIVKKAKNNKKLLVVQKCQSINYPRRSSISQFKSFFLTKKNLTAKTKNYLFIVFFVKKFVEILKSKTVETKLKRLLTYHEKIFCDLTFFGSEENKMNKAKLNNPIYRLYRDEYMENFYIMVEKLLSFKNGIYSIFQTILNKIPLFEMDSIYSMIWNLLLTIILIFNVFVTPLDLSFDMDIHQYLSTLWFLGKELPIFFSLLDMVYSLNTAYYSKGVFVKERMRIVKYYFKYTFWLDLLVVGPMLMVVNQDLGQSFWKLNFCFTAIKINILIAKLEDYFQFKDKPQGIFNLLKLIIIVLYLAHLSGCCWNYLAQWEIDNYANLTTWWHYVKIVNNEWQTKYINALYFSIVTMVTVGYGDISPQNSLEKTFSIIIIVLACGFFAYAINSIGIILKEMYRVDNEFKIKIYSISSYMKEKKMNIHLQMKVKKYLEYMFQENQEQKRNMLFDSLSTKLKEEVQIDIYDKILKNSLFFKKNFSESFLKKLSLKFTEITLAPEEMIFSKNEITEKGVYFILKGNIEYFITRRFSNNKNKDIIIKNLGKGDSFGETSLLKKGEKDFNARAITVVQLGFISSDSFIEVIQGFPQDYEIFCKIKDDLEIYTKSNALDKTCDSCGDTNHFVTNCPLLTFQANREKVIKSYLEKSDFQIRKEFDRFKEKKQHKKNFLEFNYRTREFINKNEILCLKFLEDIELKQEELDSIYNIYFENNLTPTISTIKTINGTSPSLASKEFDNQESVGKKSLKYPRLTSKQLSYTPNLKKIIEKEDDSEKLNEKKDSQESFRNFKEKHFLEVKTHQNEDISLTPGRISATPTPNINDKYQDLFELALNFENMKSYKFYYPHNNAELIIKSINLLQTKYMESRKRTFKRKKHLKDSRISSIAISKTQSEAIIMMHSKRTPQIPQNGEIIPSLVPLPKDINEMESF